MELADTGGVAHFAQGLRFDLTNPFAGDLELATDLFEGAAVAVDETRSAG
jgi:hypothetical protein